MSSSFEIGCCQICSILLSKLWPLPRVVHVRAKKLSRPQSDLVEFDPQSAHWKELGDKFYQIGRTISVIY